MALSSTGSYPSTLALFTAGFKQPDIPVVATELRGFFMQHKWSDKLSHITNGYWYNSAVNGKVRVDETYDMAYGSSLFDYTNMSSTGGVRNHQTITTPSVGGSTTCFDDYVDMPAFALITSDFLQASGATFGGIVQEPLLGETQTWNLVYGNTIPVIAYLNHDEPPILLGYDFWGSENRTKVVTRFYAQQSGEISPNVFEDFVCPSQSGGQQDQVIVDNGRIVKGRDGNELDEKASL